ncbi:MAG: redox-sensing transcriptional repressor Rex [Candidatus Omnitrophica bacterium]|nr:redox-sensing transcriptional repressor Rex [Candidatus Omnitrophota bacterium]
MNEKKRIPKSAVSRLSLYLREIQRLEKDGRDRVSSTELGEFTDLTDAQVRKDLSYFGNFGTSGSGYEIATLKASLRKILGKGAMWPIVLVGVGNIGSALLRYPGFKHEGFVIKEAYDVDRNKIGVRYDELVVKDVADINKNEKGKAAKIAIIAVPEKAAQDVADILVKSNVKCILNFAPVVLKVPEGVTVRNIDLSTELENFSFLLSFSK